MNKSDKEDNKVTRLTTEEAAEIYRVKISTIRRWIREQKLRASKPGRHYLIDPNEIERLLKESQTYSIKNAS